ncbi:MAG: ATP-binding protein [Bacteroidota bacterium]
MDTSQAFQDIDLSGCEREPLEFIGMIQAYGHLIVADASDLKVTHISERLPHFLDKPKEEIIGHSVLTLFPQIVWQQHESFIVSLKHHDTEYLGEFRTVGDKIFVEISLRNDNSLLVSDMLNQFITECLSAESPDVLLVKTVGVLKKVLNYDRVMIYQFDQAWNGEVVAESKEEKLESWLGLHYPASDIPAKARELYANMWGRMIVNTGLKAQKLIPSGKGLDLTPVVMRAVSPVHIQYLKNMGVAATMSIPIKVKDQLWGLLVFHHYLAKEVGHEVRQAISMIGQMVSATLSSQLEAKAALEVNELQTIQNQIFSRMSANWRMTEGLIQGRPNALNLVNAQGFVIGQAGVGWQGIGRYPAEDLINQIVAWHQTETADFFCIESFEQFYPLSKEDQSLCAGIMLVKVEEDYLIWFRPEQIHEVKWGGKPEKILEKRNNEMRLSPRRSFDQWTQIVKGQSLPWTRAEQEVARNLAENLQIVQLNAERTRLMQELQQAYQDLETFSYTASHDLRAPARIIKSYVQAMREDFGESWEDDFTDMMHSIEGQARHMLDIIDGLLMLAKIGPLDTNNQWVNTHQLVQKIFQEQEHAQELQGQVRLELEALPSLFIDPLLGHQMLGNLISNAIKYSAFRQPGIVQVSGSVDGHSILLNIADNGVGIASHLQESIFKPFYRVKEIAEVDGHGIGLPLVKRIIEKYDGTIRVESVHNQGSRFILSLPANPA